MRLSGRVAVSCQLAPQWKCVCTTSPPRLSPMHACEWEWRVCSQAVLTYAFIPASLANTAELWVICPKSDVYFSKNTPTQSQS